MMSDYRPIQPPKLQQGLQNSVYSYREYAPCENLVSHVACYWTLDFHADGRNLLHRIIPDGCVDIIVNRHTSSCWKAAFVEGLMSQFEVLSLSQTQSMFGIRFYSDSAQSILKFPVSAFVGQHVFLEDIWGVDGLFLVEEIVTSNSVLDIIEVVERKLTQLLSSDDTPSNTMLHTSMQYMYAYKGIISTANLAKKLSFSERHLRRTFDRELGLSPKEMLGIIRFQSMLRELYSATYSSLTDIAMKYGYYDQSHLIKNFKRYYGVLPKQL